MRFYVLSLILVTIMAFPAFAHDKESAYERVMASGELRCGYAMSPPNLEVDPNTGKLFGLERDIWREIGKELGLKIKWVEEAGWGNYIEGLRSERYDAFCNQAWLTPARIKNSTLAGPTNYQTVYGYVRIDDDRFNDGNIMRVNDPSITVPAIDGDVTEAMVIGKFPKAKLDLLPQMASASDMFLSVTTKKSDILFLDKSFFDDFERKNPGQLKKVESAAPVFVYGGYYSFNQGEYALRDMVSHALRRIIDDGRMGEMTRKYSDGYHTPLINFKEGN